MAEKASPHKKEKQPPLKMPQSAKAESKTSLKRRLFNTSINGEDDKKASKPAPKRKKPGSQPGSPTLLGTPGRTIPLSERQQLALLMQMTANEENSNPVPVQTPQSKNSHNPTTPNSSGGVKNKVNKRNERGETALHMAAIKGDSQMALNLINQGAEVNVQDFAGWTPLHEACNHGYYEVAKVLIKAGASVNTMGLEDDTPLHDAAVNGHVKVVKLLLKHGANPLQVNKRGKAPLDIACSTEIHSLMSLEIIASSSDGSDHVVRSPSSPESMASPHPINVVHNNLNSSSKVVKNGTELPEDPYEFTQDSGSSEQKITIHWASPDKSGKGANVMEITRTIPKVRDIAAPNSVSSTTTSESDLFDPHLTSTSSKLECVEEERRLPSPSISTSVAPIERTRDSLPVTRVTLTEVKEDSDSCVSETNLYISDDSNMAGETHKEVSSKADSTTVNDGILSWNIKSKLNDNGLSGKVVSSLRTESARVSCSAPSPLTDRQSGSDSRAAVSPYDFNANENEVRTMETTLTRPDPVLNRNRFSPTRSSPSLQSAHTASSKHSETPRDVCDSLSVQQESVSSNCVQTSGIHSPGKQSSGHESERSEPDSDQRTESRRESPSQSIPESRERSESDSSHETKHHGREKTKKHKDRSHKSHKKDHRHQRHHSHSSRKEEKMDTSEEATTSTQSALVQVKEDSKTHEKVSSPQVGEETQEQLSRKSPDRRSPFPAVAREYYIVSPPSSGDNAGEIKSLLLRISSDASHKSKDNTSSSTSSVSSTSASGSNIGNHKNDTKPLGNVNERTSGSNGENGNAQKSPVTKEAERRRSSPARGSPDVTSSINGPSRSGSPKGIEKAADKNDKTEKSSESSTTSSTCSNDEKQPAKVTRTLRSNSALTSNSDSNGNEEKKDDKDKATFSQPMTRSRRNQVEAAAAAATAPPNANASNNEETHMDSHPRKRKMARHRQNQQMEEALHVSSAPQEKVNSIEAFLNIRHQVAERQKTLMASVQPKPPNGYKEYLMFRKNYLLQSDPDIKIVQVIPRMTAPVNLTNGLLAQFSEQEKIRHELRLRHYIEREKLMLAAEQDIVRVHGRAARALVNQTIPFSVCTVLKDMEIYNMPEPLPLEDKSSIRQRFNGRQFISWLQDVDEKYEKLKEELLQRHQHEAASLYAIQKLEWELKLQELKQWDFKSPPPVHSSHVPIVEVNRDFDLLPA